MLLYKLHGNHKPKIYNDTQINKRGRKPNRTLKTVIKPQTNKQKTHKTIPKLADM